MVKRSFAMALCAVAFATTASAETLAVELSPAQMDRVTAGAFELSALATFVGGGASSGSVEAGAAFFARVEPTGVLGDKNPGFSAIARSEVNVVGSGEDQALFAEADTQTLVPDGPGRMAIGVGASETINIPEVGIAFSFSTEFTVSVPAPSRVPFGFQMPGNIILK